MNEFIEASQNLANQLIPVAIVVVLVFIVVLLINCIKFIKELRLNLKDLDITVDLINESLDKAQTPLDTAVVLSKTVNKVHDSGIAVIKEAVGVIIKNVKNYKEDTEE